ncbi:MAG: hypothetical protein C4529_03965 [Deltaproteobacteria bacterium]|nr:MAG: hypothetical protein C4529_03965 [Deltaproteobacteria bacterium]
MTPFEVKDCALLLRMSGLPPAMNLRELRDRIAVCGENVLYHHYCETTLRPTFDDPDYRNDFAVWAKLYLGDRVLAERLGIVDPYSFGTTGELRAAVLDVIDDRLGELTTVPWVRPGDEFLFKEATTVIFDTGVRIRDPRELAPAVRGMTNGSVYFHFLEALRRPPVGKDDFSAWLMDAGEEYEPYRRALGAIDFHFHGLSGLRKELAHALAITEEMI